MYSSKAKLKPGGDTGGKQLGERHIFWKIFCAVRITRGAWKYGYYGHGPGDINQEFNGTCVYSLGLRILQLQSLE